MSPNIRYGELWRFATSILPHAGILHLAFNAYWIWVFGSRVEEVAGPVKTLALTVLVAFGSSAAEYAFLSGGIGLSGVGYGYFGLLWVLTNRDQRFANAVDSRTVGLFVIWFFVCIVTTVTGMLPVANIAHGVGCLLGAGVGFAVSSSRARRYAITAGVGLLTAVLMAGAVVGRPYVNLSGDGAQEGSIGYAELIANRNEQAAQWISEATRINRYDSGNWFNLGIAYQRLGQLERATAAYKTAAELDPSRDDFKQAYESMKETQSPK